MANTKIPVELSSTPGIVDNSNATAITIDSSENVGIGTTSPDAPLHTLVSSGAAFNLFEGSSGKWVFGQTSGGSCQVGGLFGSHSGLVVDTSGNVGIGASPSYNFHVTGSGDTIAAVTAGATSVAGLNLGNDTNKADGGIRYDNSADGLVFRASNAEQMRLTSAGLGIGTSSPTIILHTSTSSDNVGRFESTDATAYIQINDVADSFYLGTGSQIGSIGGNAGVNANNLNIDLTNGNVGIGTTSPEAKLEIQDTDLADILVQSTAGTNRNLKISSSSSGGGVIGMISNHRLEFQTNDTERMRILSDGDVIIGGTSFGADGALSISPDHDDNAAVILFDRASTTATSDVIRFQNGGSTVGAVAYNNSSVSYNTSSDARLKNILGEAKGLEIVNKLNPVNFEWKDGGEIQDGLIAQEVEELIPHSVNVNDDGYYSMDYSKLVTPLIKAIQEQQTQIEALQSEINLLKGE